LASGARSGPRGQARYRRRRALPVMLRYLLDEHMPRALIQALRQRDPGLVAWRIGQPGAPGLETPDPDLLGWCEAHDFVLVTNNRATMPGYLAAHLAGGGHVPGIFVVN